MNLLQLRLLFIDGIDRFVLLFFLFFVVFTFSFFQFALSGNQIGAEGARLIASKLCKLEILNIGGRPVIFYDFFVVFCFVLVCFL